MHVFETQGLYGSPRYGVARREETLRFAQILWRGRQDLLSQDDTKFFLGSSGSAKVDIETLVFNGAYRFSRPAKPSSSPMLFLIEKLAAQVLIWVDSPVEVVVFFIFAVSKALLRWSYTPRSFA